MLRYKQNAAAICAELHPAMPDRRLVYPNIWWTLDGLLRSITV